MSGKPFFFAAVISIGACSSGSRVLPDGAIYVCNNGGLQWSEMNGLLIPGETAADYSGGSIQRVDLLTGKVETLYTECDGRKLRGPNGIPLSPDGSIMYYAETTTGRIWSYSIQKPGLLDLASKKLLIGLPGYQLFDSFALNANGNICTATLMNGGISIITAEGTILRHIPANDILTTSICFGGTGRKTAYITLGGSGKLVAIQWDSPGLPLNFLSYQTSPCNTKYSKIF